MNPPSNSSHLARLGPVLERAASWDTDAFDSYTRREVKKLLTAARQGDSPSQETLREWFGAELEFGTGGMRALRGLGSARINRYTISMLTQGFANYLMAKWNSKLAGTAVLTGVLAYDSRIGSREFATVTAEVLVANGIRVYLFKNPRPTPELSFAVRALNAQFGIVLTASHNPKEYSGYKVYNEQGAQVVPPEDSHITAATESTRSMQTVRSLPSASDVHPLLLTEEFDQTYFEAVLASLPQAPPAAVLWKERIRICYTPLYGTGVTVIPPCFKQAGFKNFKLVTAESELNGNFPNLAAPNPEEAAALTVGTQTLVAEQGDILFATDPDSDRVGVVLQTFTRTRTALSLKKLSGNQIALLLAYYLLTRLKATGQLPAASFIANTIVTTSLMKVLAHHFNIPCYQTFTGFKYIAELIERYAGKRTFLMGAEESYGYLIGSAVRDKDATVSALLLAEAAAAEVARGRTLADLLTEIYERFGYADEVVFSLTLTGHAGLERISRLMKFFRTDAPRYFSGLAVKRVRDYLTPLPTTNTPSGLAESIAETMDTSTMDAKVSQLYTDAPPPLSGLDVLEFVLSEGTRIIVRPSGTEPKLKFYILSHQPVLTEPLTQIQTALTLKLKALQQALEQHLTTVS